MYDHSDGLFLIKLSRRAVEEYLTARSRVAVPRDTPKRLRGNAGVFVTIETYPAKSLRGCIGYPEPVMPLAEATIRAAISAATEDPRFPPIHLEELAKSIVEISILTPPELVRVASPSEYLEKIEIGRHGLIAERGPYRGLLLPQVAVDQRWDVEEFLSHTCMKAGLMPDSWCGDDVAISRFEGRVFAEMEPMGAVEARKLR